MNRRSLLALLGAAPITGPMAVKAAISSHADKVVSGGNLPVADVCAPEWPSRWEILSPMRDRRDIGQMVNQGCVPPHIGAKRSWSVAFKAHVEMQERREMREWERRLAAMDAAGLTRIARLLGMEP